MNKMNTISKLIIFVLFISILFIIYNVSTHSRNVDNGSNMTESLDCSKVHGYIVIDCADNSSTYVGNNPSHAWTGSEAISTNDSKSSIASRRMIK